MSDHFKLGTDLEFRSPTPAMSTRGMRNRTRVAHVPKPRAAAGLIRLGILLPRGNVTLSRSRCRSRAHRSWEE